jgi:hypothetical protein
LSLINPPSAFDFFPANVFITAPNSYPDIDPATIGASNQQSNPGSQYIDLARVHFRNNILYIGVDAPGGPITAFKEEITLYTVDESNTHRLVTATGRIIAAKKDKACGCGSRLKNWSPIGTFSGSNRRL